MLMKKKKKAVRGFWVFEIEYLMKQWNSTLWYNKQQLDYCSNILCFVEERSEEINWQRIAVDLTKRHKDWAAKCWSVLLFLCRDSSETIMLTHLANTSVSAWLCAVIWLIGARMDRLSFWQTEIGCDRLARPSGCRNGWLTGIFYASAVGYSFSHSLAYCNDELIVWMRVDFSLSSCFLDGANWLKQQVCLARIRNLSCLISPKHLLRRSSISTHHFLYCIAIWIICCQLFCCSLLSFCMFLHIFFFNVSMLRSLLAIYLSIAGVSGEIYQAQVSWFESDLPS